MEYRSVDGSGNNLSNPHYGQANTPLRRLLRIGYADGMSAPAGPSRPSARDISNKVINQSNPTTNRKGASDFFWLWGQFVDHDIDLTPEADPSEPFYIQIPKGDPYFDPAHTGKAIIPLNRSIYEIGTGPRQQINIQSSFIDATNVYGADQERAFALRTLDGTGKLKTGPNGLLPFNHPGLPNAGGNSSDLYLAGDVRANENVLLTAMHSLWVREHNRIAHELFVSCAEIGGEEIYQRARQEVVALNQVITFKEFLPLLLGSRISDYSGYNPNVDASVTNVFSTAAYRLGHSLVSSQLQRLDSSLNSIDEGPLLLRDAFFSPQHLTVGGGIEPLLRGAARQTCEALDAMTVSELRNFLFGNPGQGGMDLASLNIQRGRDHGLPSYNDAREDLGLKRKTFEEISTNLTLVARLKDAYQSADDIDIWVGGLAEDRYLDSMLGELFYTICKIQFENTRDGDRFWYQNVFDGPKLLELEQTKLSDVIRRNTVISDEIQDYVMLVS